MKIKVTCDSTCDLSAELIEQYGITVIPLHIVKGEESLLDGIDIKPDDIYEYVDSGKGVCQTAAVNMSEYIEVFSRLLQDCDAIIHINISSEFSTCYNNACLAASELGNVYPVDSRNLSTGSGHLVIDAAILAQSGMEPQEIQKKLTADAEKLEVSFVLNTLSYLHKGGRCSAVAALGANLLSLKPCIEVKNGKMGVGKKYRGKLENVLVQYIRERLEGRDDIDRKRIFMTRTNVPDDIYEKLVEAVKQYGNFETILHTYAGCTITNHCGPRCFGILFYRK